MTLKSQIASDTIAVFFNTDEMAQTGKYFPKDGPPRDFVYVQFVSPRTESIESHHELEVDTQQFSTPIDPEVGMTNPQRGDAVCFEDDAPQTRWDFAAIIDSDENVFMLRFSKKKIQRAGHVSPPRL